jgi:hypothetical protein
MKERSIIFSGPMVRVILDGRKTQTRRVIKNPERLEGLMLLGEEPEWCPYGGPGDLLYVRECFRQAYAKTKYSDGIIYKADQQRAAGMHEFSDCHKWKPSIHMPKKHARIWLMVEAVWADRVQEITASEIEKEGAITENTEINDALPIWIKLWDTINKKRGHGWDKNPWVWVVEFSVTSTTGRKVKS